MTLDLNSLLAKLKQTVLDSTRCLSGGDLEIHNKGPNDFVTRVDMEVSEFLCLRLPKLLPDSQVISEERKNAETGEPYHWIIDPIDGTNNLVYGLPFFAVSVGLVLEKEPLLGAIFLPASGELFSAAKGSGAFVGNVLLPHSGEKQIHVNDARTLRDAIVMAETDPYFDRKKTGPSRFCRRSITTV
jgi:myo-inositol-1(or 4)-monophosphatase